MEDSGPGRSPRDSAVMILKRVNLIPCIWIYQLASLSRTSGSATAGPSSNINSRARPKMSSKSGAARSPTATRSFISVVIATFQPSPTSPRRWLSGTRTSVKKTSLKFDVPAICLMRRVSMPGDFMSRKK